MIGEISVTIKNRSNSYSFVLRRNITVLCGNSGTGKTTLYSMIREYERYGKQSGVTLSCQVPVTTLEGDNWLYELKNTRSSIVVIDEDSRFIISKEFADAVKKSDNYYLIISRNYLPNLPFSVDEVFELQGSKSKKFVNTYKQVHHMYDDPNPRHLPFVPEVIVTEDSRSGYKFFNSIAKNNNIECVSAKGKSNIYDTVKKYSHKDVVVIADGAAFGPEMQELVELQKLSPRKIAIFLPESFEWIILSSGVLKNKDSHKINVLNVKIDSSKYLSWEQYFTDLLIETTKDNEYMKYNKSNLMPFYLQSGTVNSIKTVITGIKL